MDLRDYQENGLIRIREEWKTVQSTAAVMATGLGKTILFAHAIKGMTPKRSLVIAHRKELIDQARDKIYKSVGLKSSVEMGWSRADDDMLEKTPVVLATVQSLNSNNGARMRKWRPEEFGLIVCDEFHHGTAPTYRRVFDYFGQNPELKILGVTATPDRADEEAISQICQSVAFQYDILDGVNDGWLVPITQQFCSVSSLDFSHCRTTAGDLNQGDLEKIMEAEENVQGVCHPAMEVLYGLAPKTLSVMPVPEWGNYLGSLGRDPRHSIVFTVSVAQAQACCNIFNRVVPGIAEFVCGKTPIDEREEILERFTSGQTSVIANCGVLTEGFDCPSVEVIFMARPTKSRSLYTQMVGRATRPLPGIVDGIFTADERKKAIHNSIKPYCRIIDFVGNSGRHKLISTLDVLSGKKSDEVVQEAIEKAKKDGKPVMVLKQLSNAEAELERKRKEAAERFRLAEEARKKGIVAKTDHNMVDVDAFGSYKFDDGGKKYIRPIPDWIHRYLKSVGIPCPDTYNQAFHLWKKNKALDEKRPAREGQLYMIRKKGGTPTLNMTAYEASEMLRELGGY